MSRTPCSDCRSLVAAAPACFGYRIQTEIGHIDRYEFRRILMPSTRLSGGTSANSVAITPERPTGSRGLIPESIHGMARVATHLNGKPRPRLNSACHRRRPSNSINCKSRSRCASRDMRFLSSELLARHSALGGAEFSRAHIVAPPKFPRVQLSY